MSRFRFAACLACVLALSGTTAFAAPAGFAFLEVPAGARAAAMGGAYSAVADGVEAAFWNPAGLAGVRGTQVTASHIESFEGLKHDQFALAGALMGGGLAGSVRAMYSQPIDERDELGNLVGSFGSHDLEFQTSYGRMIGTRVRLGFGAQAVRERIASEAATTWSASTGMTWDPARFKDVRMALTAQHLGRAAHYVIDGQRGGPVALPAALQGGVAWNRAMSRGLGLGLALDTRFTRGRQGIVALGSELRTDSGAALRLGLRQGDDIANFSAGVGYRFRLASVDYAWVPSKLDLGDTHRFSFGGQF